MEITDWLIALGSLATAVVAIVAICAISENRTARVKENKVKILERIADWVLGLKECPLVEMPFIKNPSKIDLSNWKFMAQEKRLDRLKGLLEEGEYLNTLAKTNKVGQKVVDSILATHQATFRFWIVTSIMHGKTIERIEYLLTDAEKADKELSDFINGLKVLDSKALNDLWEKLLDMSSNAGNKLLSEVSLAISRIYS